MKIEPLAIPDVLLITPKRHGDERGWFSETFRQSALDEAGFSGGVFVQDNHARSTGRGVLRGLHFQRPPRAQDKLVRCVRGAVFDVAVDIRRASPTFGRWVGAELSAENGVQLLVPKGFAHGYCTLTEDCEVLYKVTDYYAPQAEGADLLNTRPVGSPRARSPRSARPWARRNMGSTWCGWRGAEAPPFRSYFSRHPGRKARDDGALGA